MDTHASVNATLTFTNEKGQKVYIVVFRDENHMNEPHASASFLGYFSTDCIINLWEQHFKRPYEGERTHEAAMKAVMTITHKMYFETYFARTAWEDLDAMYTATPDLGAPLKVLDLTKNGRRKLCSEMNT